MGIKAILILAFLGIENLNRRANGIASVGLDFLKARLPLRSRVAIVSMLWIGGFFDGRKAHMRDALC